MELNREKIKAMMILKNWNNSDLAREMNTSREWTRQIMQEKKDVRLSTVDKIANALGFPNPKDLII